MRWTNTVRRISMATVFLMVLVACGDGSADTTTTTASTTTTTATTTPTTMAPPAGDAVQGGLLYDKWWKVVGLDEPSGDNPIWARQTTNERSGGDTWRCKECHGWDYQGADGAYGSGSHFTGFPGILGTSKSVVEVMDLLSGKVDPEHDFSVMGDEALADLAVFVTEGLEDYGPLIGDDKAIIGGDVSAGGTLYAQTCASCHGADGTQLNFGDDEEPEYVGTIALGNPWEFFHKVRFGQPGSEMPSAIVNGWSLQDVGDVIAFSQTLPTAAGPSPDAVEGGLLYDKWWKVLGLDEPTDDNPIWARQTTNERSGADTWRCKECHGWDYRGADGAYGSGSHLTGFPGILGTSKSASEVVDMLSGRVDPKHDFSVIGEEALAKLAAFVTEGLEDYSPLIDPDTKAAVGGDAAAGAPLYSTACAACHGDDGTQLNFGDDAEPEYLGTIAAGNPWEFFHKVRFGQPGTSMPSAIVNGWSLQQVLDVLTFAQTLATE